MCLDTFRYFQISLNNIALPHGIVRASLVGHSAHQGVCAFFLLLSGVSFARAILLHYYSTVDIHIFSTPHFSGCCMLRRNYCY